MKRKPISKKIRHQVYKKYGGRCAYCGCELKYEDMQVDHIDPCALNDPTSRGGHEVKKTPKELNDTSNLNPSCRMCNFYKSSFSLEKFRERLQSTLLKNVRMPFQFRLAEKYGIVEIHEKKIEFYFEKWEIAHNLCKKTMPQEWR